MVDIYLDDIASGASLSDSELLAEEEVLVAGIARLGDDNSASRLPGECPIRPTPLPLPRPLHPLSVHLALLRLLSPKSWRRPRLPLPLTSSFPLCLFLEKVESDMNICPRAKASCTFFFFS